MAEPAPTPAAAGGFDEVDSLLLRRRGRPGRAWRWVPVGLALLVIAGWAVVAGRSLGRDPKVVRSPLVGRPAPAFRLPALGGGEVDSASYRGEVLVVNFWASWCVPCVEEAPELQAFAARWSGRGVHLVGVAYNDDAADAAEFRDRFGLTYPQALDTGGRAAIDFGVFGVPETYVIDGRGTVMSKVLGAVDAATLERVLSSVADGRTVSTSNDRYRAGPG